MEKLQKIMLTIVVVGVLMIMQKMYIINHQVMPTKNALCENNRSHSTHKTILTVEYSGQLGNNIWEYMSLLAFIHLYGCNNLHFIVYLPIILKAKMDYVFESIKIHTIPWIPKYCSKKNPYVLLLNESLQFDKLLNSCPVKLGNYSARYEEIIQYGINNIKKELRFRKQFLEYSDNTLNRIKANLKTSKSGITFVGMHYRGTDYIDHLKTIYGFLPYGTPNATYYLKAMDYFNKKYKTVVFILITIDFIWLTENLHYFHSSHYYIVINPNKSDNVNDLALLSQCNHSIINYGTFGTTAAFFSGGTTFVYNLGIPLDHRGPTVAMGIANILPNWHILT